MHHHVRYTSDDRRLEAITQTRQMLDLLLALGDRELRGARKAAGRRDVLSAGSTTAILRAAVEQRLDHGAAPDVHCADSLRRADLVARDREHVERNGPRV